ncbi:conserved hypothetical protein [Thioalkalivibrio sp. K90mix]|uniref:hypothetical protein n=1 Tax=Thioalkalivibrio sp. (strain K90mix) TaxID=396595 RepID=UPI000195A784|nr:hypothetical protein [Thioalkalivibrio sp. K90mix]ADC70592.1 conserved hypothetical protein [Thioalkalivibrio sp. K90mix]
MHIHLDTTDLMTRVRLESRWRSAGATVTSGDGAERPDLVVIDLAARDVDTVATWRERCPDAAILAFGPHVEGAMLKAARQAGADEVVVRGKVADRVSRRIEGSAAP